MKDSTRIRKFIEKEKKELNYILIHCEQMGNKYFYKRMKKYIESEEKKLNELILKKL